MLNFAYQEHVRSYYFDSRNQDFQFPPLTQIEHADACVIGAGFFGLSAALELAEKGKKVIVLEGARGAFFPVALNAIFFNTFINNINGL